MTVHPDWLWLLMLAGITGLYVFAYLLLLGYTCWLHKRVLRLEHLLRDDYDGKLPS